VIVANSGERTFYGWFIGEKKKKYFDERCRSRTFVALLWLLAQANFDAPHLKWLRFGSVGDRKQRPLAQL